MKSSLILFGFLLSAFFASAQDAQQAVKLDFDKRHIDLGDVVRGDTKEMQFKFINMGTDTIQIDLVSSCDCTEVDYPRGKIAPGENGLLDVIFDSTEKEESETVDIDIILTNIDPKTEAPIFEILTYGFNLKQ